MIGKCTGSVDNGGAFSAVMTDISKASDGLPYQPSITKLDAYGLGFKLIRIVPKYRSVRKQRVKVSDACSSWKDMVYFIDQY